MTVICQQSDILRMQNTSTQKWYYCRCNSLGINMDINYAIICWAFQGCEMLMAKQQTPSFDLKSNLKVKIQSQG
jgi:hypothetical protein